MNNENESGGAQHPAVAAYERFMAVMSLAGVARLPFSSLDPTTQSAWQAAAFAPPEESEPSFANLPKEVVRALESAAFELQRNKRAIADLRSQVGLLRDLVTSLVHGDRRGDACCGENPIFEPESMVMSVLERVKAADEERRASQLRSEPPVLDGAEKW